MATPIVSCLKGLFLIFNFIFWLTGLGLLVVGILSKFAFSYLMKLSTNINYNLAPYIMIACGVFIILVGFIGCWAAVKEHGWALKLYMVVLVILFIVEMTGAIAGYVLRNKLKDGLKEGLEKAVKDYYTDKDLKEAMDKVQESYVKCCGVTSYADYFNSPPPKAGALSADPTSGNGTTAAPSGNGTTAAPSVTTAAPSVTAMAPKNTTMAPKNTTMAATTHSGGNGTTHTVPKSCCKNKDGSNCKYQNLHGDPKSYGIYMHGCYDELLSKTKKNFVIVGGVALGIAIFQLLGVICAYLLIKNFSSYEKM